MGLHKHYLKVGQNAKNKLFGIAPGRTDGQSMPLNMLISQQGRINHGRLAVIMFGLFTLVLGIILSFVPWLDYIIFRDLKLWNGSISYSYWQKPGVVRLTRVYIFNVSNPQGFLDHGEKPRLTEIGPFVYREDMEKVNIKFHDNDTVTFQHNKILRFVPDMSVDKSQRIVVPNIPLLTLTTHSNYLNFILQKAVQVGVAFSKQEPFVRVTADELVFGYDDPLVSLAHTFYPRHKRPMSKMGLLLARNGTLNEVSTIYTGHQGMDRFGYLDKVNGLDHLPYWRDKPCTDIRASEGSFFPPRHVTKSDVVQLYDKDLCRILPLQYRKPVIKDGIKADLYTPPSNVFQTVDKMPDNKCYCPGSEYCPPKGLQNISPCQYDAPVYLSFPHFYDADPTLMEPFEGLKPIKERHETYFMIQPKLGVPVEGQVRVQLNLKVERAAHIASVAKFPDIIYPIMWLEEGIEELTPSIWRWMYLATTVGEIAAPLLTYSMIVVGLLVLIVVFIRAYKKFVFSQDSIEIMEIGRETLRRGSTLLVNGSHRILAVKDTSYTLLSSSTPSTPNPSRDVSRNEFADNFIRAESFLRPENFPGDSPEGSLGAFIRAESFMRVDSFIRDDAFVRSDSFVGARGLCPAENRRSGFSRTQSARAEDSDETSPMI